MNNNHQGLNPMTQQTNCLICGRPLQYTTTSEKHICYFCKQEHTTTATCTQGHFVCNHCHSLAAHEIIEQYCIATEETNPFTIMHALLNHPSVHMHGPEHHFLVPAVLLAAYYNSQHQQNMKLEKIGEARKRAEIVEGGMCGTHGTCGAAIGVGIFISLILDATPLSNKEWKLATMSMAQTMNVIADIGGPRCCKRNTFIALQQATQFLKEHLNIELSSQDITCTFSQLNKECKKQNCPFYPC